MNRILLWGMGNVYNQYVLQLQIWEQKRAISIVGITARDIPSYSKLDGWSILNYKDITNIEFDYILVMSKERFQEILEDIISCGIDRKKVLKCSILDIPYFSWVDYFNLYENNLSIISSSCVGGMMYRTLGMECLSPFKNLFVDSKQLCKTYRSIPDILRKPVEYVGYGNNNGVKYPMGKIEELIIHFNHDTSFEIAKENWERRVKKVNYNNMFLQIYADDAETVDIFIDLTRQGVQGSCFVSRELSKYAVYNSVYELKTLPGQNEMWEVRLSSASNGKNSLHYSLIDMLNGKKVLRLE